MRITAFGRCLVLGLGVLALPACGSDTSENSPIKLLKMGSSTILGTFGKADKPVANNLGLTRAKLAEIATPVKLVTIERNAGQALIVEIGKNRGVETWSSVDNKTLSTRDGIIVATHGLGEDLTSAAVPTRTQLAQPGHTYQRRHIVLDGEDRPVTLDFACHTTNKGPAPITVVERAYAGGPVQIQEELPPAVVVAGPGSSGSMGGGALAVGALLLLAAAAASGGSSTATNTTNPSPSGI